MEKLESDTLVGSLRSLPTAGLMTDVALIDALSRTLPATCIPEDLV